MSFRSALSLIAFFGVLSALFFMWGLTTTVIKLSVSNLKSAFEISLQQALLVKFNFFLAYAFFGILSGKIVSKTGFKTGLLIGLGLILTGILYLLPASLMGSFARILPAFFIIGCGITFLQVSANPLAAGSGDPDRAAQRLNFAQGFNALGAFSAPFFASIFIYSSLFERAGDPVAPVRSALLILSAILLCLLVFIWRYPINIRREVELPEEAFQMNRLSALPRKVYFGAIGIFLYVGAEVSIASTLITYLAQPGILNLQSGAGSLLTAIFFGGALIGRFLGASVMIVLQAPRLLALCAAMAMACAVAGLTQTGIVAAGMVLALGLFNSVQFPTIFALSIEGLGPRRKALAAGVICTGIVGGGLVPQVFGWIADTYNLGLAFIVPVLCYTYILIFALNARRTITQT